MVSPSLNLIGGKNIYIYTRRSETVLKAGDSEASLEGVRGGREADE